MAYTPGPWGFDKTEVFQHARGGADGVVVADVLGDNYQDDARLIAAAPTLLGCCIELWKMAAAMNAHSSGDWSKYQHRLGVLVSARAVIEGATGSTLNKEDKDVYDRCLEGRDD
jgi:hypothetical protein